MKEKITKYKNRIISISLLIVVSLIGIISVFYDNTINPNDIVTDQVSENTYIKDASIRGIKQDKYDYLNADKQVIVAKNIKQVDGGKVEKLSDNLSLITFNDIDSAKAYKETTRNSYYNDVVDIQETDNSNDNELSQEPETEILNNNIDNVNIINDLNSDYKTDDTKVNDLISEYKDIKSDNNTEEKLNTSLKDYLLSQKTDNNKVTVAVLDSGITVTDTNNSIFKDRIIDGINYSATESPDGETNDDNGHGTAVASIITNNTYDNVNIMPIKVIDSAGKGTLLSLYQGIEYAIDKNVDVINISLSTTSTHSELVKEAIKDATNKGIIVVTSAGNYGTNVKYYTPANMDEVITVASVDNTLNHSDFSNYGETIDYAALGEDVSVYDLQGKTTKSGTSFATAKVTAIVSYLKGVDNTRNIEDVKKILNQYTISSNLDEKYVGNGILSLEAVSLDDKENAIEISDSILPTKNILDYDNWKDLSNEALDDLLRNNKEIYNVIWWQNLSDKDKETAKKHSQFLNELTLIPNDDDTLNGIVTYKYYDSYDLDEVSAEWIDGTSKTSWERINIGGSSFTLNGVFGSVDINSQTSIKWTYHKDWQNGATWNGGDIANVYGVYHLSSAQHTEGTPWAPNGVRADWERLGYYNHYAMMCSHIGIRIPYGYYIAQDRAGEKVSPDSKQNLWAYNYDENEDQGATTSRNIFNRSWYWNPATPDGSANGYVNTWLNRTENMNGSTFYIYFTPWTHTVKFDLDGGSGTISSFTKTYGQTASIPSTIPTKYGYTFNGWKGTDADNKEVSYAAGANYNHDQYNGTTLTLKAQWKLKEYTISYDHPNVSSQIKYHGETLTLTSYVPTKSGYIFDGWEDSNGNVYQAGSNFTTNANTTLKPKWKAVNSSIAYKANNAVLTGSSNNWYTKIYNTDENISLSDTIDGYTFEMPGYKFTGWCDNDGSGITVNGTIQSDLKSNTYIKKTAIVRNSLYEYTLYVQVDNSSGKIDQVFVPTWNAYVGQGPFYQHGWQVCKKENHTINGVTYNWKYDFNIKTDKSGSWKNTLSAYCTHIYASHATASGWQHLESTHFFHDTRGVQQPDGSWIVNQSQCWAPFIANKTTVVKSSLNIPLYAQWEKVSDQQWFRGDTNFDVEISYTAYTDTKTKTTSITPPSDFTDSDGNKYYFDGYFDTKNNNHSITDDKGNILAELNYFNDDNTTYNSDEDIGERTVKAKWRTTPYSLSKNITYDPNPPTGATVTGSTPGKRITLDSQNTTTPVTVATNGFTLDSSRWKFLYWSTSPEKGKGNIYRPGYSFSVNKDFPSSGISTSCAGTNTLKLYAQWEEISTYPVKWTVNTYVKECNVDSYKLEKTKNYSMTLSEFKDSFVYDNATGNKYIYQHSLVSAPYSYTYFNQKKSTVTDSNSRYLISSDGSTIINLYYDRSKYVVNLEKDDGINTVSIRATNTNTEYGTKGYCYDYGSIVTIDATTNIGYSFSKWVNPNNNSTYTTNTHYEFTLTNYIKLKATSTAKQYQLIIKPNGGSWKGSNSDTILNTTYQQQATIENPTAPIGYTFNKWNMTFNSNSNYPSTFVGNTYTQGDIAKTYLSAEYKANTNTPYKVNCYYENANDNNYSLETKNLVGVTDSSVTINPETYRKTGFKVDTSKSDIGSKIIKGDGTTVFNIYYTRNRLTVDYNTASGIMNPNPKSYNGKTFKINNDVIQYLNGSSYVKYTSTIKYGQTNLSGLLNPDNLRIYKTGYTHTSSPWSYVDYNGNTQYLNCNTNNSVNGINSLISDNDSTATLNMVWNANTYTITLNPNTNVELVNIGTSTIYEYYDNCYHTGNVNNPISNITVPIKIGYTFEGYYTSSNGGEEIISNEGYINTFEGKYNKFTSNVTLYAHWTPNKYNLVVNPNGGILDGSDKTITYELTYSPTGSKVIAPNVKGIPTKTGYTFVGWSLIGSSTYKAGKVNNTSVENGKQVLVPISSNGYTYFYGDGDVALEAKWIANTYKITFNTNGNNVKDEEIKSTGTTVMYEHYDDAYYSDSAIENIITKITPPTRKGHTFLGYYTKADGTGDKVTDANGNITVNASYFSSNATVYAKWQRDTHTLTVKPKADGTNGETAYWNGSSNTQTFNMLFHSTKSIVDPTRRGYTFNGWKIDGKFTDVASTLINKVFTMGDANTTLTANWVANTYTITLNSDDADYSHGTGTMYEHYDDAYYLTYQNSKLSNKTTTVTIPIRKGYTFLGYYTQKNGQGDKIVDNLGKILDTKANYFASNATIYAHWKINQYKLTVKPKADNEAGETAYWNGKSTAQTFTMNFRETKDLPIPTRRGYTFAGWEIQTPSTTNNVYGNGKGHMVLEPSTITLVFSSSVTKYTYKQGDADTVVVAKWTANIYTITLDSQGADYNGTTTIYEKYDNGFYFDKACTKAISTIDKPKKIGHTYQRYYLPQDLKDKANTKNTTIINKNLTMAVKNNFFAENTTIKAEWKANVYKIVYNGNRNTGGSTPEQNFTWNTTISLNPNGFVRTGWQYVNWNTKPNGSGYVWNNSQAIDNSFFTTMFTKDELMSEKDITVTLYARWKDVVTPVISKITVEQETLLSEVTKGKITLVSNKGYDGDLNTNLTVQVNENNTGNDASGIKTVKAYVFDKANKSVYKEYELTNISGITQTKYDFYYDGSKKPYSATYKLSKNLYTEFPNAADLGIYIYAIDYQGNSTLSDDVLKKLKNEPEKLPNKDVPQNGPTSKENPGDTIFHEVNECVYTTYLTAEGTNNFFAGELGIASVWTYGYVEHIDLDYKEINTEMEKEIAENQLSEDNRMNRGYDIPNGINTLSSVWIQPVRIPPYVLQHLSQVDNTKIHQDGTPAYKDLLNLTYSAYGIKHGTKTDAYNIYNIEDAEYQDVHYRSGI